MRNKNNLQKLSEPGVGIHLLFLIVFALATLYFKMYYLAAAEAAVIVILIAYALIARRIKEKQLSAYIESVAYDAETAKNSTLMNFPLPIAVFRLDDSTVVWGNESFFECCGVTGSRLNVSMAGVVPSFSGKWLLEGKTQYPELVQLGDRKYQLYGKLIRSDKDGENNAFMGICYWVDMTEYDNMRQEYDGSHPVPGVIIFDNLDELCRNQPDRVKNEIREGVEDLLHHWSDDHHGIFRRYDRDRYLVVFQRRDLADMRRDQFAITRQIHQVVSPNGVEASVSIGLGEDGGDLGEGLQFADMAVELALSRGGDQAVIKNRLSFEFFGGRGMEVEKRTKVKSRVMANTLAELMRDSSKVLVMGHRYADLDAVGAAAGACCMARKCGVRAQIVIDKEHNAAQSLLQRLSKTPEYKDAFLSPQEAMLAADGRTLLVVVDTNRPDRVEDADLLAACNRVAVIDHHRVAATYIQNAALGFIEPYASSASELLAELLQELTDPSDVYKCEAEAMLAGIVLDTKSFSLRTGERTFDAASWLRHIGADTTDVKRLFQTDMESTVAKFKILQSVELYRSVAIAAPEEVQGRVVAAQAADELLNISGVEASVVLAPDGKGNVFASARSIGEMNVQILLEKLGGGGNRSAAAVQFTDCDPKQAVERIKAAIDEYLK